jgi:hypothetical protein
MRRRAPRTSRAATQACAAFSVQQLPAVASKAFFSRLIRACSSWPGSAISSSDAGSTENMDLAAARAPGRPHQGGEAFEQRASAPARAARPARSTGCGSWPRNRPGCRRGAGSRPARCQVGADVAGRRAAELVQQAARRVRQRGHRRQRIHDLVGQHVHQLAPGVQGLGFEFALDRHQRRQPLRPALQASARTPPAARARCRARSRSRSGAPLARLRRQLAVQVRPGRWRGPAPPACARWR